MKTEVKKFQQDDALTFIRCLQESYMVNFAYYTDEISKVLHQHYQGQGKPLLYLLHGLNTDSNNFSKPADFEVLKQNKF